MHHQPSHAGTQPTAPAGAAPRSGLPRGAFIGLIAAAFALCLALGLTLATCSRDAAPADDAASASASASSAVEASSSAQAASSDVAASASAPVEAVDGAAQEELRAERIAAYHRILSAYQAADRAGDAAAGADSPIGINLEAMNPFVLESELVYTTYDVAGDGEEELLIARKTGEPSTILYELVGFDADAHEAKKIGDFTGYRSYCTVCEDGLLIYEGSGGANTGARSVMRLPEHGTEPIPVASVEWDFEGDFDNVKFWYTDAEGNKSECEESKRDEIIADCKPIENFDWSRVADFVPDGQETNTEQDTGDESSATDAAATGSEGAGNAANEQLVVDFATQFYTNTTVNPDDHTQVGSVGDWSGLVKAYIEPGSAAAEKFYNEIESNPFGGLGAGCIVVDSEVISSQGNTVVVRIAYCGTQNPLPGWADPSRARDYYFTCAVSDNGLIESYETSQTPPEVSSSGAAQGGTMAAYPQLLDAYVRLVAKYRDVCVWGNDVPVDDLPNVSEGALASASQGTSLSYAYIDINGDDIVELVFASQGSTEFIDALYASPDASQGSVVYLTGSFNRVSSALLDQGILRQTYSSLMGEGVQSYWRLPIGAAELEEIESVSFSLQTGVHTHTDEYGNVTEGGSELMDAVNAKYPLASGIAWRDLASFDEAVDREYLATL